MRVLRVLPGATIDARAGFLRDQRLLASSAETAGAFLVAWRRSTPSLAFGRFHRLPVSAPETCERRLSGGRAVSLGPGILGITLVVPGVEWLDPGGVALRPDQVLNRALRPLLACLRERGWDAFYAGRDLVTVGGRTVAHASFGVAADGVTVVEVHVAVTESFSGLPRLLEQADPEGVAAVDTRAYAGAASLAELAREAGTDGSCSTDTDAWSEWLAGAAGQAFACEIVRGAPPGLASCRDDARASEPYSAFLAERGPAGNASRVVAAPSMLGAVEAEGRIVGGKMYELSISGDLIAPFHTLEAIEAGCEGLPCEPAAIRKRLASVFSMPRNFVLGYNDLDLLLGRLGGT